MSKPINVLSLFNGMSCGMMALDNLGVNVERYYSSEIDKYANQAAQALYPNTVQLGDITRWKEWNIDWSSIDLVTGGFPCQAWSMAGKRLGDKDERGMLFWAMLEVMKNVREHNPKAEFLIENVKMKREFEECITHHTKQALGSVHKILINSALVSAQNRNRYYWTSFEVEQPEDRSKTLESVLTDTDEDKYFVSKTQLSRLDTKKLKEGGARICFSKPGENVQKSECLMARDYKGISGKQFFTVAVQDGRLRKLTPRECMRLQTIPERHIDTLLTAGISNTQLYKMTGNGWTVDVISHILKGLK